MNFIWKIDDWIMSKHQWVADRVYSRFELSPYEIAAHCFGVVILTAITMVGIWFQELSPLRLGGCAASIAVGTMWFWISITKHKRWQKDSKAAVPHFMDAYFRVGCFMPSLLIGLIGLSVEFVRQVDVIDIVISIRMIIFSIAFYFYGCNAPTFIERKEHKLVEVGA